MFQLNINKNFYRSLGLLNTLSIDYTDLILSVKSNFLKNESVQTILKSYKIERKFVEQLNDIHLIELKKVCLDQTFFQNSRNKSFDLEVINYRERLLSIHHSQYNDIIFSLHPHLILVKSKFNWVNNSGDFRDLDLTELSKKRAGNYSSILLQTRYFSPILNTSIVEIALNEYELFILQQFNSNVPLSTVRDLFSKEITHNSNEELGRIELFFYEFINRFIYNRILIPTALLNC